MRATTRLTLTATVSASAMLLAACGGGSGSSGSTGSGDSAGKQGGSISVRGCNPENPLIPGATTETCGGDVIDAVTARLVHYNVDTAKPENDIAESIETKDNQNFTVKLKKGYKFSDGTEVKAKNFVDAWNYTALSTNAQGASYFMEPIEGFADLQAEEGQTPKAKTMSGLKVVDDTTFTIKTTDKVSNLPERLGYSAFAPLPDSFAKDPKAFGDKPIGAGPYTVESWTKNQAIVLKKNPNYSGANKGSLDQITFKIYQDSSAAYNDVMAGNLDVTDEIPSSAITADKYKTDLPDRNAQKEYGGISTMTFASAKADPAVQNPKVRQAISMAVDREAVIKSQFNGTRTPATGWVATTVNGYKAGACGEFCTYDAAKAKALLQEAGGFKGKLTLSYNADASHKDWTEATCQSIKEALAIDCVATPVVDFKTFRTQVKKRGPVPVRLADGLPVDRELPHPDLRHGCLLQRRRLLQQGLRRQAQGGRRGNRLGQGQRAVPGGRGHAQGADAGHPAVVPEVDHRLVAQGHQRQDLGVRQAGLRGHQAQVTQRSSADR